MAINPDVIKEAAQPSKSFEKASQPDELILSGFPSATTIVFILILTMSLIILMPYTSANPGVINLSVWFMVTIIVAIPIFLYLIEPQRLIRKYRMQPVEEIAPEILAKVENFSNQLGMAAPPKVMVTNAERLPVQTFSTFAHQYIVINQAELMEARKFTGEAGKANPLDPILIHELAHLRNGDTWKLQLSRKIVLALFLFALIMLLSSFANRYVIESVLLGSPTERAGRVIDTLSFVALMLVNVYLLKVMSQVREFYADDRAKNIFSKEEVVRSLGWSSRIWSNQAGKPAPGRPFMRGLRAIGLAFLADSDFQRERMRALLSGVQFHAVMRQVLFAGGLAVGISTFYLPSNGVELLSIGFILGGSALGIIYLFPLVVNQPKLISNLKEAFKAALIFGSGIVAILGAQIFFDLMIGSMLGAPFSTLARYDLGAAAIMGLTVLNSAILAIALGFVTATFYGWKRIIQLLHVDKPGQLLFYLLFAQTMSAFILMDVISKLFFELITRQPASIAEAGALSLIIAVIFCIIPVVFMQRGATER